jgi:hypothetical protein
MKVQISPISTILITGVIISLVGVAYFWGVPLIEKQSTSTDYSTAKSFMEQLDSTISEIANSGGSEELSIPLGVLKLKEGSVGTDNESNTIVMEFTTKQPIITGDSVVYLGSTTFADADNEVGVFGKSSSSVMALTSETRDVGSVVKIALHYRELDTQDLSKGYKIVLVQDGLRDSGNDKMTLEFDKTETEEGAAANGGDLIVTYIKVKLS